MRALAEFIMRGRLQAGAVAVLGYIVPLLAPIAVAFVTLHKGAFEGTLILFLGLSPALLSLVFGEGASVVVWVTLLSLFSVYVPALVLRFSISLSLTIVSSVLVATVLSGLIVSFAPEVIQRFIDALTAMLTQQGVTDVTVSAADIAGLIAYSLALNSVLGVLLGRWFQALAFNPGGFGDEFRELRLGYIVPVVCFVGWALVTYSGSGLGWWANVFAVPLLLKTLAIAHSVAKAKDIATPWLVLFYIVAFNFISLAVIIGLADTWFNFRDRMQKEQ